MKAQGAVAVTSLIITFLLINPRSAFARDEDDGGKVYDQIIKGVVWVVTPKDEEALNQGKSSLIMTGTGSLIDKNRRLILTNYHVVGTAKTVYVVFPHFTRKGRLIVESDYYFKLLNKRLATPGKVLFIDAKKDLALVQLTSFGAVSKDCREIKLASKSAGPGQHVHSVGNPGKSDALWVYTPGTVRQVYHKKWKIKSEDEIFNFEADVVMTQSATNPGDSGGPLVNDHAELVGVTQGGALNVQLLSYFIDVSEVRDLLTKKKLIKPAPAPAPDPAEEVAEKPTEATKSVKPVIEDGAKNERLASSKLNQAQDLESLGKVERAREYYQAIVTKYPKTEAADKAKKKLEKLKN